MTGTVTKSRTVGFVSFLFFSLPPTRGTRSKHFYIRKKEEEEEGEDTAREKV
jgi:hypothetical protein